MCDSVFLRVKILVNIPSVRFHIHFWVESDLNSDTCSSQEGLAEMAKSADMQPFLTTTVTCLGRLPTAKL